MRTVVGTRVHEEILGLIDRAERFVVLISPFVRMWPDLRRALARAVGRGVHIGLITRGPERAPANEDLAVLEELESEILEVPRLHLKAYLSERDALQTTANLTRESVDSSLETSELRDRETDREAWNAVFEVWMRTLDLRERIREPRPVVDVADILDPAGVRARADSGDADARDAHCYCIVCGSTASQEGEQVVCLRCRAGAIAEDRRPDSVVGSRCARCNGPWRGSTVERPLCGACYREELAGPPPTLAEWCVLGRTGAIEAWSAGSREPALPPAVERALDRRWALLLPETGWLAATLTAPTRKPLDLWQVVKRPGLGPRLDGVRFTRHPARVLPPCPDLRDAPLDRGLHLSFEASAEAPPDLDWSVEQELARWDLDLPDRVDPAHPFPPAWLFLVLVRRAGEPVLVPAPGEVLLGVDLALTLPADRRPQWAEAAAFLQRVMLASLHSYAEVEVRDWLAQGAPPTVDALARALARPAPLGPATLVRAKGKVRDLPSRTDRVATIRVALRDGPSWHLRGTVATVRRVRKR